MQAAAIIDTVEWPSIDGRVGARVSELPAVVLQTLVAPRALSSLLLPPGVWESLMSELSDAVIVLRMVYQAMQSAGVDAEAVLNRLGMAASQLDDAGLRTPHAGHHLFWRAVEEVSGDRDAGLHLAAHIPVFRGQVLE